MKPAGDERAPGGGERATERPAREQLMTVRSADHDGAVVLAVDGEIDGLTAPRLRTAMRDAIARLEGRLLVVDLTQVGFLGSPGLRILTDSATEAVQQHGCQPIRLVVDCNRPVIRPVEIIGLDSILALHTSVEEALP